MRKFKLFGRLGTAFTLMMLLTTMVAAQSGLPATGWYVTAVIQNISTTNGSLTLEAFPLTGTATGGGTASTTLDAGKSVVFRADNPGNPGTIGIPGIASGSFQGSMVLSSDVEVVSVAALANAPLGTMGVSGGKAEASYNGVSSGSTVISAPAVKSGFSGNTTSFFIQSAGSAATIAAGGVVVKTNDGLTYTNPSVINIEANKTYVLLVSSLRTGAGASMPPSCPNGAGNPCIGAMTVTASAPIVGTVVEYIVAGSPAVKAMSTNMFSSTAASTKLYCPAVKNQFSGASTGVAIQNVSGAVQDISISIKSASSPTPYTHTFTNVPNGASVVASRFANTIGGMPANNIGAMTITAAGNILAINNEISTDRDASTACASDSQKTTKIAMPVWKAEFPSKTSSSAANTGAIVQNVGTTTADITGVFSCRSGSTFTDYTVIKSGIAAGASAPFSPFSIPRSQIPTGQLCSVIFTSANPIVSMANNTTEGLAIPVRDTNAYEGFNLVP